MDEARAFWLRIETLHAVTYFGEESRQAAHDVGLPGFWRGYFAFRAAPMGPVGSGLVHAVFFNFAPSFVSRWVPQVWESVSPESMLVARAEAAAATLRRLAPSIDEAAPSAADRLEEAADSCAADGHPLFGANGDVDRPADPVARLWQACTTLREHRGDGHVAALTAAGLTGLEAHVLITAERGTEPELLQLPRGWTDRDWAVAVDLCRARGLTTGDGALSEAGVVLRREVEATTDRLASPPLAHLGRAGRRRVEAALTPAARSIASSGVIPYPNAMGLPPIP